MASKMANKMWGVVVLAAGASSRMGKPKQLLQWNKQSLLRCAAQTALAWSGGSGGPVCVVLGANAASCREEIADLPVLMADNGDWESGMAASLRAGVQAIVDAAPDAAAGVLVLLCDQPHIGPEVLSRLFAAHQEAGLQVTASAYNDTFGVPALFERAAFSQLLTLSGAEGAKSVIKWFASVQQVCFVPVPEAEGDVDTPGDYARLTRESR